MSRETAKWLNTMTLIGCTDDRGNAWHYRAEEQGDESNHYPGFIPAGDVIRRLFDWTPTPARVAVEVPATFDDMTHMGDDGQPLKWAVQDDRKAIVTSDNADVLGMFKSGYEPHGFAEWLIGTTSNILGDSLGISSAGLLSRRAVAWVEVSVPETLHMRDTGVTYRPNLLGFTSCDGTLATGWKRTVQNTVCDNTMAAALGEIGQVFKVKHTRYSGFKLDSARAALNIVTQVADTFEEQVRALTQATVTDLQWSKFLDAYVPTVDDKGAPLTGRSLTMADNKRDTLKKLWIRDPRVSPWQNTVWGVVQAVNTYTHHEGIVRNVSRAERNMLGALKGTTEKTDQDALKVLAGILSA